MTNKIPKIIHYCWFGNNPKNELIQKCIESWKKHLPDYEIREWNNKDLEKCNNQYAQEAAKEKKWAFVSDYFRLYALYTEGGIYLDSDNEVFKSFNDFLDLDFFTGYEEFKGIISAFTAVVGAKKHNPIIKELLDEYENLSFYKQSGALNMCTNTKRVEAYFNRKYKVEPPFNPLVPLELEKNSIIFPSNYFCKYEGKMSYAVHHFNGSWISEISFKDKYRLFKNWYIKIYTIKQDCFLKSLKTLKELFIFAYPRFKKRTVLITFAKEQ